MKFVTVKRVMADAELSRSAAYALMHTLCAVRFGTALRLPEQAWMRYCSALCRNSERATANSLPTAISSTEKSTFAANDPQGSSTMVPHKPAEPRNESAETSKLRSLRAKAVARAALPSEPLTMSSLRRNG